MCRELDSNGTRERSKPTYLERATGPTGSIPRCPLLGIKQWGPSVILRGNILRIECPLWVVVSSGRRNTLSQTQEMEWIAMGRRNVRGFNAVAKEEELWNRWRRALRNKRFSGASDTTRTEVDERARALEPWWQRKRALDDEEPAP